MTPVPDFWEVGAMYSYVQKRIPGRYSPRLRAYIYTMDDEDVDVNMYATSHSNAVRTATRLKFRDGQYNFMLLELNREYRSHEPRYSKFLGIDSMFWVPRVDSYTRYMKKL
jgi:hypothetical protein